MSAPSSVVSVTRSCVALNVICAPLMQVSVPRRLSVPRWCRFLCLGYICPNLCKFLCLKNYLFPTCKGICAWEVLCASLVQVSVPEILSVPHWCRFLYLGGSLCLTFVYVSVFGRLSVPHWCWRLCMRGYLFLTRAVSVPGRLSVPYM